MKDERRAVARAVSLEWKDDKGEIIIYSGLTENIGRHTALIYLPRKLPNAGDKVCLRVDGEKIEAAAVVIRVNRNAEHPQASLKLIDSRREWKRKVFDAELIK